MAKRTTPSDKVIIDPLFAIPEGTEDQFEHSEEEVYFSEDITEQEFTYLDSLEIEYADEIDYDEGYDDEDDVALETPETFNIIAQTLRRAPGGQQVVDIVVDVDDVAGATNYEIQVTKI